MSFYKLIENRKLPLQYDLKTGLLIYLKRFLFLNLAFIFFIFLIGTFIFFTGFFY